MIGIDRKRHEALQERIKRLEELSVRSGNSEIQNRRQELEARMRLLCEQFVQYHTMPLCKS